MSLDRSFASDRGTYRAPSSPQAASPRDRSKNNMEATRRLSVASDNGSEGAASAAPASPQKKGAAPTEESHICVLARVRPFNSREIELHNESIAGKAEWDQVPLRSVIEFSGPTCIFLDHEKDFQEKERFNFDQCFWSISESMQKSENGFADQDAIFRTYGEEILRQTWKGFNTCFFAYGQTGSGKTYSMMGDPATNPGLIPRLCKGLFDQVEERRREADAHKDSYVMTFRVEVRYIEIYNELVKDLLFSLNTLPPETRSKMNPENMKIRSSPATGVFVEHLTAVEVDGWERMIELIDLGNSSRHVAATKMNERSSRSHAIFKISLRQVTTTLPKSKFEKPQEHIRESQINLVDLAGSERNKKTGATGDRLKEAANINKSLSCLKGVIDALADNSTSKGPKKRIPYRESHLTALLMDSLGGNSKTFMLVCLSPHSDNADETLQTLRYGARARQIVNVVHVNENAASRAMMDLEEELERMKENLDKTVNSETVENLKAQIQEQEQTLAKLEADREEQERKLTEARRAREKEYKSREAIGFANVLYLLNARNKKAEYAKEAMKLQRELDRLVALRDKGEAHVADSEKEQERLKDATADHKQKSAVLENEIHQWERKQSRLTTFKKELLRTVEDQLNELRRIKDEKIATILRARLMDARLSVNFARELRRLNKEKDEDVKAANAGNAETQKKILQEYRDKEVVLEEENRELQKKCDAIDHEYAKMDHDKTSQIHKLEAELAQLKKDFRNLSEENALRLKQTEADWEKKHAAMVVEAEQHYAEVQRLAEERHAQMVESKEREYKEIREKNSAKKQDTVKYWEEKKAAVTAEWEAKVKAIDDRWKESFEAKMKQNEEMREQLHKFASHDKNFSDMAFRINSVLASLPNPKWRGTTYRKVHADIIAFKNEYLANAPSKARLEQLLKADYTLSRATQAPIVWAGDGGRKETPRRTA